MKIIDIIVLARGYLVAGKVNQPPFSCFGAKYFYKRIKPIITGFRIYLGKFKTFFQWEFQQWALDIGIIQSGIICSIATNHKEQTAKEKQQ